MPIHAKSLFAETYVVTSSVTSMSIAHASGSTIFGDSADDTHQFSGSLTTNSDFNFGGSALPRFFSDFGDNKIQLYEAESTTAGIGIVDLDGGVKLGIGTLTPNASLEVIGNISGSSTSTGSFGHIMQNGKDLPPVFVTGSSTYVGDGAGIVDDGSANRNVGIGVDALNETTTGDDNTAVGFHALKRNTTGQNNTAIGKEAMTINTTGESNTAVGFYALLYNTDGNSNAAVGLSAARGNTTGDFNSAFGRESLFANETAFYNTGYGYYSLKFTKGAGNTGIGAKAGLAIITGTNNTLLGYESNTSSSFSTNQIVIGHGAVGIADNTVTLGNTAVTDIYFSSGSTATLHTGNISGSSTSTGSFGAGYIDNKLGIGKTNPTAKIDIQDHQGTIIIGNPVNDDPTISITGGSPYGARLNLTSTNANGLVAVQIQNYYLGQNYGVGGDFHLGTTIGSSMFVLTSTGNVGIGTNSPTETLHLSGSGTTQLFVEGNISGSSVSTGSFGRIEADVIEAKQFRVSSSVSNIVTIDVSGSTEFGDTLDDTHRFTGSVHIQSGSLAGEMHIVTNTDRMFVGRYGGGIPVSGSINASRYVTGSDGSIIDIGFTALDEYGNTVLTTTGDGVHVNDRNYWYNSEHYRVGSNHQYLSYDTSDVKVKGQLVVTTGSYDGEMYIDTGTSGSMGKMFIGKYTGGIPVSGSVTASRYATGSDGSIVDVGFTTVDEDGNTIFTTTGDGIYVDDSNYWYTTGHFKIGSSTNYLNWDNTGLSVTGPLTASGDIIPSTHNSYDLGSDSARWANIYSADLQLSNEGTVGNEVDGTTGNWTIQEGEEDLFILNRKTGKKYRFKLEEMI